MIHRLDQRLVNQIAAGEVIVRPSSALKELIENSLDAGARRIEIAVESDARSFTIRDDGSGMNHDDAALSVERYATSKIREFDDLSRLTTRGFRGEALAAISSVCRFELMTRRREDEIGTHLRCEGGENLRVVGAGLPAGTTIHVRDLFYNTPARMKFLRAAVQEWGHMLREITRQSLTRPDVAFSVRWRGQPYLNLPAAQSLRDRLAALLPGGAGNDLIDIDHTLHEARAFGCITSPKTTRRDRRHQYFFINGRPITARTMTFALQEAYRGLIMTQQFPLCAIFLELPGEKIDVNVHPTKEEVRLLNEPLASGAVHRSALEALRKAELVPHFSIPQTPGQKFANNTMMKSPATVARSASPEAVHAAPQLFAKEKSEEPSEAAVIERIETAVMNGEERRDAHPADDDSAYPDSMAAEEATLVEKLRRAGQRPRALAQVADTYILAESQGLGLVLVDQHAAHEKLLYIKYRSRAARPEFRTIQDFLVPHTFDAAPGEREVLELLAPLLSEEGFETQHFGGGTFVIQSVPVIFEKINIPAFVRDLIDEVGRGDVRRELDRLRHKIGAMAACRAAIKAGDHLTLPEMQSLLDQVIGNTEAMRCPHGRPTLLLLSKEQLDRQFGRLG